VAAIDPAEDQNIRIGFLKSLSEAYALVVHGRAW
jgi:hypothetical protein